MTKFGFLLAPVILVSALASSEAGATESETPTCGDFAATMFYGHEAPRDRAYWSQLARNAGAKKPDLAHLFWQCAATPGVPFRDAVRERLWVQRDMKPGE